MRGAKKSNILRTFFKHRMTLMSSNQKSFSNTLTQVGAAALVVLVGMLLLMTGDKSRDAAVTSAPVFADAQGLLAMTAVAHAGPSETGQLKERARQRLIEKAVALYIDTNFQARHRDLIESEILARSDRYIRTILSEQALLAGRDGLMSLTVQANVDVVAVQKALHALLLKERVPQIEHAPDPATGAVPLAYRISLRTLALPEGIDEKLLEELTGLRAAVAVTMTRNGGNAHYEAVVSGASDDPIELVGFGLLRPLHQKLGKACLGISRRQGFEITLAFESSCNTPEILGKFGGPTSD